MHERQRWNLLVTIYFSTFLPLLLFFLQWILHVRLCSSFPILFFTVNKDDTLESKYIFIIISNKNNNNNGWKCHIFPSLGFSLMYQLHSFFVEIVIPHMYNRLLKLPLYSYYYSYVYVTCRKFLVNFVNTHFPKLFSSLSYDGYIHAKR